MPSEAKKQCRRRKKRLVWDWLQQYKSNTPCADCGKRYHFCVMDFDHVRGDKKRNLGKLGGTGWTGLFEEIAKCDLVCANCHRLRTQRRKDANT